MYEHTLLTFGRKIANLREQSGLTQKMLARRIGISPSYLGKVECGKSSGGLSVEIMFQIAEGLGVNLSDLLRQDKEDEERTARFLNKRQIREMQRKYISEK